MQLEDVKILANILIDQLTQDVLASRDVFVQMDTSELAMMIGDVFQLVHVKKFKEK